MISFKLKFLTVHMSIFTCYLDRLTNPVPSVLNIMRLCLPELFKMPAVIKLGGTDPLKGAVFCVILSKNNKTALPSKYV